MLLSWERPTWYASLLPQIAVDSIDSLGSRNGRTSVANLPLGGLVAEAKLPTPTILALTQVAHLPAVGWLRQLG